MIRYIVIKDDRHYPIQALHYTPPNKYCASGNGRITLSKYESDEHAATDAMLFKTIEDAKSAVHEYGAFHKSYQEGSLVIKEIHFHAEIMEKEVTRV